MVAVRNKTDRIGVWLSDATHGDAILHVGKVLKERLGIDGRVQIGFEAHQDNMNKVGSTTKAKYLV